MQLGLTATKHPRHPRTSRNHRRKIYHHSPGPRIVFNECYPSQRIHQPRKLTNDPLWLESFVIDGKTGFVSEEPTKSFNADAAGYVQLVEAEYKAISDIDKHYADKIGFSIRQCLLPSYPMVVQSGASCPKTRAREL
ncbi:hypothetical protein RR46_11637 [Papilio xuthus]|uniref:Uncharacterized protein n=1 Tax=Papilio xuthus TaxID=66420 RepID=A0A194PT32_PAPXU|nr:hypothetical protein RR46_11637 [Papilio xuthus]